MQLGIFGKQSEGTAINYIGELGAELGNALRLLLTDSQVGCPEDVSDQLLPMIAHHHHPQPRPAVGIAIDADEVAAFSHRSHHIVHHQHGPGVVGTVDVHDFALRRRCAVRGYGIDIEKAAAETAQTQYTTNPD
jgi:hypothetical protein